MIWLLVRHGNTAWNEEGRHQGQTDTPLSAAGRLQAHALARRLADTPIDAVYSSNLSRAHETACILVAGRDLAVQPCRGLRERSIGRWEGLTPREIEVHESDRYAAWRSGESDARPEGAEAYEDVADRIVRVGDRLQSRHTEDETILVVGHGGSLPYLFAHLMDLPPSCRDSLELSNASLSVLEVTVGSYVARLWNDTSHLKDSHWDADEVDSNSTGGQALAI